MRKLSIIAGTVLALLIPAAPTLAAAGLPTSPQDTTLAGRIGSARADRLLR